MIFPTFDLELYPPLRSSGAFVRLQGRIMELLQREMERECIRATFFCTGEFAINFPELIESLSASGNEIANHTMNHVPFKNCESHHFVQSIEECTETIESMFGIVPIGFRAPGGNVPRNIAEILKRMGYIYDSSVCRTYIPGWYEGGLSPIDPYHPSVCDVRRVDSADSSFMEIPIGRFRGFPIPLGGVFLSSLPLLGTSIINDMCLDDRIHVMYFHPVDLLDLPSSGRYIWDYLRIRGQAFSLLRTVFSHINSLDARLSVLAKEIIGFRQ